MNFMELLKAMECMFADSQKIGFSVFFIGYLKFYWFMFSVSEIECFKLKRIAVTLNYKGQGKRKRSKKFIFYSP